MSTRPAKWMRPEAHDLVAGEVLRKYAKDTGWVPSLPVPVEQIIERSYGLTIGYDTLPEDAGEQILGALFRNRKLIVVNETHLKGVLRWLGPFEFTLAHELGHWIYDVDHNEGQEALFETTERQEFCRGELGLSKMAKTRESNADRFAARLLMPRDLALADLRGDAADLPVDALMERWRVSRSALRIRLEELSVIHTGDQERLRFK